MPHQSEIETRTREVTAPVAVVRPGEVAPADRVSPPSLAAARSAARRPASSGVGYARGPATPTREGEDADAMQRRRRRGGRGRRGDVAEGARLPAETAPVIAAAPEVASPVALEVRDEGSHRHFDEASPVTEHAIAPEPAIEPQIGTEALALETVEPPAAPVDRTAAILAASNGGWIEAMAPFVPSDRDASGAAAEARRRRRRGGRRGGRGRRPGVGASPERGSEGGGSAFEKASAPNEVDHEAAGQDVVSAAEGSRSPSRRRRRRGGSGRRRSLHEGGSSAEPSDGTPTAAVTAPAEPAGDS